MTPVAKETDAKARKRMAVILQVEAGLMTATDGAKELGISRQAYYEWADRPNGRPAVPQDEEKEELAKELEETKADLDRALLALDIKNTLETLRKEAAMDRMSGQGVKKNTRSARRVRKR